MAGKANSQKSLAEMDALLNEQLELAIAMREELGSIVAETESLTTYSRMWREAGFPCEFREFVEEAESIKLQLEQEEEQERIRAQLEAEAMEKRREVEAREAAAKLLLAPEPSGFDSSIRVFSKSRDSTYQDTAAVPVLQNVSSVLKRLRNAEQKLASPTQ